ncbi:MAG: hypothetical protein ABFD96_13890 [Armatimonadia bacterium]
MSQHDLTIDNALAAAVRADITAALQGVGTLQAGPAAPSPTYALMPWADTSNNVLKIRNAANSAWIDTGIALNANRTRVGAFSYSSDIAIGGRLEFLYGASGWALAAAAYGTLARLCPAASGTLDITKGLTVTRASGLVTALNGLTIEGADLTLGTGVGLVFPDASEQLRAGNKIIVHQANKMDTFTMTSETYADVTGLSVTFTPVSASSVMLVLLSMQAATDASYGALAQLLRDATPICVGAAAGNRIVGSAHIPNSPWGGTSDDTAYAVSAVYLDSPATASSVTYKVQVRRLHSSGTVAVNRSVEDTDDVNHSRQASSLIVLEIA